MAGGGRNVLPIINARHVVFHCVSLVLTSGAIWAMVNSFRLSSVRFLSSSLSRRATSEDNGPFEPIGETTEAICEGMKSDDRVFPTFAVVAIDNSASEDMRLDVDVDADVDAVEVLND